MYTYFLRNRNVEGIIVYFCREATILGNIRWLEGRRNLLFVRVRLLEKVSVELSRIVRIVDNRRIERLFVPWRITNACSHRSLSLSPFLLRFFNTPDSRSKFATKPRG